MDKISRYDVLEEIGRGSMGIVYKAHDPSIDRLVAIKVIDVEIGAEDTEQPSFLDRFLLEARSAGGLSHPHIVTVHDVGVDQRPYIVMEYFPGTSLSSLLDNGRPDPEVTRQIGIQIAGALGYAHQRGIVHRDVKLANVLYLPGPSTKLVDFGIASTGVSDLTSTGELLGTPHYMSPETFTGATADGRSDLFSLGVVLYQLLTCRRPFESDTIQRTVYQIIHEDPRPPRHIDHELPEFWDFIIPKLMAKDPAARYQSGEELVEDLERATGERPTVPGDETVVLKIPPKKWQSLAHLRSPREWRLSPRAMLILVLLVLVTVFALRATTDGNSWTSQAAHTQEDALLRQASTALERGNLRKASARVNKLLRANPEHVRGNELLHEIELTRWTSNLPLQYEAKHDHRIGSCTGQLTLAADRIEFASEPHGRWSWSFGEVRSASRLSKWKLRIETHESEILRAGSPKNYNFSLFGSALDDGVWDRYLQLLDLEPRSE